MRNKTQNDIRLSASRRQMVLIVIGMIIFFVLVAAFFIPNKTSNYSSERKNGIASGSKSIDGIMVSGTETDGTGVQNATATAALVTHVTLPKAVKGLYMSSWVAGTPSLRSKIVKDIERTEANAIIIDIKDYTGMISFVPNSAHLQEIGCIDERIKDISSFIKELHDKNIYVIGRVAVFQDPCMVKKMPDQAVKTKDGSKVWKDHKGISWMDTGSSKVWEYNVEIAKSAQEMGFDEINFDYIRYPSDGNMVDISFPISGKTDKAISLEGFFKYIDKELRGGRALGISKTSTAPVATSTASSTATPIAPGLKYTRASDPAFDDLISAYGLNISGLEAAKADTSLDGKKIETTVAQMPRLIISADLFGMVTNNTDDLGIGQVLERAAPYLDFIGPMVYPSHYPPNFMGYKNPSAYPYEIVKHAMDGGVTKLKNIGLSPLKLRPWLQDFNLGVTYTADMVRKQIKATYDAGLTSWMLWDASNTYTPGGSLSI